MSDHAAPALEAPIVAADKSTIAEPASATSGLQNYDLEGARARRRKRRRKKLTTEASEAVKPAVEKSAMSDDLNLFIPLTKIDAAKRLVYGVVTAESPDVAGEICDYASTKPLYQKWSDGFVKATDGKSFGNLRAMHGNVAAGKLTEIAFDDVAKKIEVCAHVVDDAEWRKVDEGVYTGFSQGGKYVKCWPDPADSKLKRYTAEPFEISLVDNPCLPDATFSVIKADGSTEMRKFKHPASDPENNRGHVEVQKSGDAPNDNEVGEQVWINPRLPGKTFKKKAELRQALIDLDAEEAARKTAAPVIEALAGVKDKLAKAEGGDASTSAGKTAADPKPNAGDGALSKKDYSDDERKEMAAKGEAKKDGSYPIKTAKDVGNAVADWYRSKGSASDKRHIIKRAKSIGATDQLPADWPGSTKKDDSKKVAGMEVVKAASLFSVSNLLLLLDSVQQAEDSAESDAWGFGPTVDLPKELTDRFGTALVELGDIAAEMLDVVLASIKTEETSEAVAAAARALDLSKLALAKVGARHSKDDKERIKTAHDALADLDPDCCPGADDGEGDDADKMIKALQSERDADRKAFEKTLGEIMVLIKQIADQPQPMGASSVTLRTVDKEQDFNAMADRLGARGAGDGLERLADAAQRAARGR